MWIPEETLEAVRSQSDIVGTVSQYVELKKQGKNHFGHCPFHDDRTPSFSVQEEKQFFHCFSCGRGGNVFSFVMEIEGIDFPEAVVKTAELNQIPLNDDIIKEAISENKAPKQENILKVIHKHAQDYYHHILMNTIIGQEALSYLKERGLTEETLEKFQLGYSPPQREALLQYLESMDDFNREDLEASGLFSDREDGELLDRFSNRIIFPIKDGKGDPVAFSGRSFLEEEEEARTAKYLNSPETKIFNKSTLLFNFDLARPVIRREKEVYLFEGYMDVIQAFQAGIENGIATMGTSLTEQQIRQLEKTTETVVIAYDGDQAGQDATDRTLSLLRQHSTLKMEILIFPQNSDPDDYLQERGKEKFQEFIKHERETPIGFYMEYYRRQRNLNNESEQLEYIDQVLKKMVYIHSPVERDLYFNTLEKEFSLSLEALKDRYEDFVKDHRQSMSKRKKQPPAEKSREPVREYVQLQYKKKTSVEQAENHILHRMLHFPDEFMVFKSKHSFGLDNFETESAVQLSLIFEEYFENYQEVNLSEFFDYITDPELKQRIIDIEKILSPDFFNEEDMKDCMTSLTLEKVKQEKNKYHSQMAESKKKGDVEKEIEAFSKIIELSKRQESLESELKIH